MAGVKCTFALDATGRSLGEYILQAIPAPHQTISLEGTGYTFAVTGVHHQIGAEHKITVHLRVIFPPPEKPV